MCIALAYSSHLHACTQIYKRVFYRCIVHVNELKHDQTGVKCAEFASYTHRHIGTDIDKNLKNKEERRKDSN